MTPGEPIGVLVMAYGGPASLDEIPGYLADIRHGRPTPRAVVDEITENYRAIGGASPLLDVSRRQVGRAAQSSSETTTAATSECATGHRGSRTSWARW